MFIVFEGPDGAGTTTQAQFLSDLLTEEGSDVLLTQEPTDGQHGQKIRELLASSDDVSPEEIQKLFVADRADHVEHVIKPALGAGTIVICDRYIPSTLIYGEIAGVDRSLLEQWNQNFPEPDATILTLPPFEVCWQRVAKRTSRDSFEQEEFQRKVYGGYERYAEEHSEVFVIDTSQSKEDSKQAVRSHISASMTA